ncbi:MAG: hypothetical protein IKK11_08910, partial [Oscillospiraceae bacterium]|nr:hypothetical protein [Oscillospiraceae bacterium]
MKQYKRTGNRDLASGFILKDQTLAHLPKSEFVESEKKIKSLLFRHFIYVKLGSRARALPAADTARAQSVLWSAGDAAVRGKETAGYHKRTAGEV